MITLTDEQFQLLLAQVMRAGAREGTSANSHAYERPRSFADCTASFDGSQDADVDAFLDAITVYKDCVEITDLNALRGLPMLLNGAAASWWRGVKNEVQEWNEAVSLLRAVYSKRLPPHRVYREIFSREQDEGEKTELFVCRFRELLSQLPYQLPEEAQLDMLYGLLRRDVRKRVLRAQFTSYAELRKAVRDFEASVQENEAEAERKNATEKQRRAAEGAHLLDEERTSLEKLLEEMDVFGESSEPTQYVEHVIETGDVVPVALPPCRIFMDKRDALQDQMKTCLLQGEPPNEQPVKYASRTLTTTERNYSTMERKALAIVGALQKYRGYVKRNLQEKHAEMDEQFRKNVKVIEQNFKKIERDRQKASADAHRRPAPLYNLVDRVLVKTHFLSQAVQGVTAKLLPKREKKPVPEYPKRKRGRPPERLSILVPTHRVRRNQRGRM